MRGNSRSKKFVPQIVLATLDPVTTGLTVAVKGATSIQSNDPTGPAPLSNKGQRKMQAVINTSVIPRLKDQQRKVDLINRMRTKLQNRRGKPMGVLDLPDTNRATISLSKKDIELMKALMRPVYNNGGDLQPDQPVPK